MSPEDMAETTLNRNNRRSIKLTLKNMKKSMELINIMHSKKGKYPELRKTFMKNYVPDIMDIDT